MESRTVGHNLEDVLDRDEFFSLENPSNGVDLLAWQFGQVGNCALARFLAFGVAKGLTEQNGGFGVAVGHNVDMHGYYILY